VSPASVASNVRERKSQSPRSNVSEAGSLCPNKRLRILNRAAHAFLSHGYEGANLEEIANAAAISKATIYKYFTDKNDLFTSVVVETSREMGLPMRDMLDRDAPIEEVLTNYAVRFVQRMIRPVVDDHPFFEMSRLIIGASQQHPELARSCRDIFAQNLGEPVREYFAVKLARAEIQGDDGQFLMTHFMQMLFFTNAVLMDPERTPVPSEIRPAAERTVRLFLYGCKPSPAC
jgi:TetR/AcrR family transcriptional regulator, mexJK operon transcriptional repressor